MDLSEWNFHTDEEIAEARSNRGKRDGVFIASLRPNYQNVLYFLTFPGESVSDWVNFRELNTREGLWMDVDLPSELTYGIIVQDDYVDENPITGKRVIRYDNNRDPLTAGEAGKQLWRTGPKNVDRNGFIQIKDRCAVNVVDAVTGYQKVLKMSLKAKEDLVKYFRVKNEDGDFDITGRPYKVLWTGEGFKWDIDITAARPGSQIIRDDKVVEIPRITDLPAPLDVRQVLIEQRQQLDAIIASLPTRSGRPAETGLPDDHFMSEKYMSQKYDPAMDTSDMAGSSGLDVFAPESKELTEKYLAMSPARLRAMFAKAGIDVEKGTSKERLAEMAVEHSL